MVTIKIVCLLYSTEIYREIECGKIRIDQTSSLARLKNDNIINWLEPNGAWKGFFTEIYRVVGDRVMDISVSGNRDVAEALQFATRKVSDRYTINVKYEDVEQRKDVQNNKMDEDIGNKANETLFYIDQIFAKCRIAINDIFRIVTYVSQGRKKTECDFRQIQQEILMIDREIAKLKHTSLNDTDMQLILELYKRIQNNVNMVIRETTTILSNIYNQMDNFNNVVTWQKQYSSLEVKKDCLSMISRIEPDWKYIDSITKDFDAFWEETKISYPSQAVTREICGRKGLCLPKSVAVEYGKTIHRDAEKKLKKCMSDISAVIYDSIGTPINKIINGNTSDSYNNLFDEEMADLKKVVSVQEIPSDNVDYINNVVTIYEAKEPQIYEFIEYIFIEDVLTNQRVWFMQYMETWQHDTIEKTRHIIYKCKAQAERQVKVINGKLSALKRREQEYRRNLDNNLKKIDEIKQKQSFLRNVMESMPKKGV